MTSVPFTGASSVLPRTVFTNHGPIVKSPLSISSGTDLLVISPDEVQIPSASFTASYVGRTVVITGSPGGRNDGTFYIKSVKSSNILKLDANLDYSDPSKTLNALINLSNELKSVFNQHISHLDVHGLVDSVNTVTTQIAVDLTSACILLNSIKNNLSSHSITAGGTPFVHKFADPDASIFAVNATDLPSAVLLANALRARYDAHRQDVGIHIKDDFSARITNSAIKQYVGTGSMVGPFPWIIQDPRNGVIADSPSDVSVLVNGSPATVDYVFGLLGAVVLQNQPAHGDTVLVDYKYLKNPPTQLERLNSFEFVLNQENNNGISGIPGHLYRQRSYLLNPGDPRLVKSPTSPQKIGYKYKAEELCYTARLNDPGSLLLNSPTNKIMYDVLTESAYETVVRYDPVTLPQYSTDPWVYYGEGNVSLTPSYPTLIIEDTTRAYGVVPGPPFYSHPLDLTYSSYVSAAYRFKIESSDSYLLDGDFTGVGFGFTNGNKATVVGGLVTDANNLSSAIALVNDLKSKYTSHISYNGVHRPIDTSNVVTFVDAYDRDSLVLLTNQLLSLYSNHIAIGPNQVHLAPDTINTVLVAPCNNLDQAIAILNDLRNAFNAHQTQSGVHYVNDSLNFVNRIKQVGILSNRGFWEDQYSWNSFAYDWTIETTYRLYIDSIGNAGLYLSGDISPRCSGVVTELPDASSLDLRFDPVYQSFFGALGDNSSSRSYWRFSRIDILPVDSVQVLKNKEVTYALNTKPEYSPTAPWIVVGQGGSEYLLPGTTLMVDSMAVVSDADATAAGIVTGEYRGYLRIEPSITDRNTLSVDFTTSAPFCSFGVDNKSLGVHIGDGTFATQLCFLQANPVPAIVIGSVYDGSIAITTGDTAVISVNNGPLFVITSPTNITTAADLANLFNSTVGYGIASVYINPFTSNGTLQLTSPTKGADSLIRVISGSIFDKLGITTGVFVYGSDSQPEPKVSWAGIDTPDLDSPAWNIAGGQGYKMQERTLVLVDGSVSDYISFTQANPYVMNPVVVHNEDWKMDYRVKVKSYTAGDLITSSSNYYFCGVVFNLDEGPLGKNLELHLSKDTTGNPYLVVYSYNIVTKNLDYVASSLYNWDDSQSHSYSIYTDKVNNLISIYIDGVFSASFNYSTLNPGSFGPSITFGSGSNSVNNGDLSTALSVTEWSSVCGIHDSTVNNSYLASERYVGLYKGGDTTKLSSYHLTQVDWKQLHSYRIVRDPVSAVSVFIDGSPTASISASYDVLTLPLNVLDFLAGVVPSGRFISFGSFNSEEICRSIWVSEIKYSIGKLTQTDGIVPPHQILNQANSIVSSEHLRTDVLHKHFGFNVYSGGTPEDDFLADPNNPAVTVLGDGTPPVPQSQDLTYQGGLTTTVTPTDTLSATSIVFQKGQIANFINDETNVGVFDPTPPVLSYSQSLDQLITDSNLLRSKYLTHIASIAPVHQNPDLVNNIVVGPVPAGDLAGLILMLNDIELKLNSHLVEATVHYHDDTYHTCSVGTPTDLASAITTYNSISDCLNSHINSYVPHTTPSTPVDDLPKLIASVNLLLDLVKSHYLNVASISADASINPSVQVDLVIPAGLAYVAGDNVVVVDYSSTNNYFNGQVISYDSSLGNISIGFNINITGMFGGLSKYIVYLATDNFHVSGANPYPDLINVASLINQGYVNSLGDALTLTKTLIDSYNAHLLNSFSHNGMTDITNTYISSYPIGLGSLKSSIQNLTTLFNSHLSNTGGMYHTVNDTIDIFVYDSNVEFLVRQLCSIQSLVNSHVVDSSVHIIANQQSQVFDSIQFVLNGRNTTCDPALYCSLTNTIRTHLLNHFISESHLTVDYVALDSLNLLPSAVDFTTAMNLVLAMQSLLEQHAGLFTIERQAHSIINSINLSANTSSYDPLPVVISFSNVITGVAYGHFHYKPSHVKMGPYYAPQIDAMDLTRVILNLNLLKSKYNEHRTLSGVHVRNDTVNIVTAPDAVDLDTSVALLNDIITQYDLHRVESGVHSNTAIVRLTVPNGVLYDGLKFWTIQSGVPNLTSTFSDDETWYLSGGLKNQKVLRLTYPGMALPDNISLVSSIPGPFSGISNKNMDVVIDYGSPITVIFQPTDISVVQVINRINGTPGIPSGFATYTVDGRLVLTNPNSGSGRNLSITGTSLVYLGLDTSQPIPWALTADDAGSVSVGVVSASPDYLAYTTTGSGTRTAYVASTGLTDSPSLGFKVRYRIKINTWAYVLSNDTGIYVGCSSNSGPGYTVGIGFIDMSGNKAVILKDMNSGAILGTKVFNWGDGAFHEYQIERKVDTDSLELSIIS